MGRHGDSQRDARRLRTIPGPELELEAVLGRLAQEEGEKEKMRQTNPFSAYLTPLTRIPPPKMASFSARRIQGVMKLPNTFSYFRLFLALARNGYGGASLGHGTQLLGPGIQPVPPTPIPILSISGETSRISVRGAS